LIYQNVELHNIEEIRKMPGSGGVRLQRVPEEVRMQLNESAQMRMLSPACAEIRFVSDLPTVRLTLSSEGLTDAIVFHGVFQSEQRFSITKETQTIEITAPERLQQLSASLPQDMPFSSNVCRVMLAGDALVFHGIEQEGIRPPRAEELPQLRYLAYGTSITHGSRATGPHLAYVSQTARRLGADLINLGVGGSAHCEHELADYIASRDDWDVATLALSVNMGGFSLEAFSERVSYMVNTVAGANTHRPVACVTLYPYYDDLDTQDRKAHATGRRQSLRDAVAACPHPNVHLFEGPEILSELGGLIPDLIHPADNGMIQMGENLARKLRPLVDGLGAR
jgi:lysophospholipase L1-like esterase